MKTLIHPARQQGEDYWKIIQGMNTEDQRRVMCRMFGYLISHIELKPEVAQKMILDCFHTSVMPVALNPQNS